MDKTNFPPTRTEILDEFAAMPDWDERYEYLIELGRELPELDEEHMTQDNLVQGCMSTVWLVLEEEMPAASGEPESMRLNIHADSDALIVKGLIVVLLALYEDKTAGEIVQCDEKKFLEQLGLDQHLSPSRRNGLFSMVTRVKQLATERIAART